MTIIIEHNLETNTQVSREMTEQEQAYLDAFTENIEKQKMEETAKATQKAALLNRLGITADEAKLLLA